ncbi:MAG: hypothetical protein DWQ36_11020 [Acidobacteria bacterium]|nr:MAG: hypothetical protein DWQ36_11020 [Acidobacteriota bacterium]
MLGERGDGVRGALLLGGLLLVIVACAAVLLVDRFVVQPRRAAAAAPPDQRLAAEWGFEPVAPEHRQREVRRLLAGFEPFVEIDAFEVPSMVVRREAAGSVWAFELDVPGAAPVARPGSGQFMELEMGLLQPVVVVERDAGTPGEGESTPPFWFGFRPHLGSDPEGPPTPWAELLADVRQRGAASRIDLGTGVDVDRGLAGTEQAPFVAMSPQPERAAALLSQAAVQRMASWPDVLFLGEGGRLVLLWPPPNASLAYWAARSTNPALVPSLSSPGVEWDLQRAVDVANRIAPEAPPLARVVEIEVEVPEIPIPELDLAGPLEEIRRETERENAETMAEFERDLEEFRRRNEENLERFRRSLAQRLEGDTGAAGRGDEVAGPSEAAEDPSPADDAPSAPPLR